MKYTLLSATFLFLKISVSGQDSHANDTVNHPVFTYVEKMPAPGYDMGKYISENLRYPDTAIKYNIEGRVIVKFIVNEDGRISGCEVIKSIGGGCDEEAVRVVSGMPAWKPGQQKGKPVKVWFTQPMVFKLED